jgi:hypothetical protein
MRGSFGGGRLKLIDAMPSTPDEMAAFMRREQERYATIIRNANIKVEQ